MTEITPRKVAFLDTNVLHFIGLYLHQARKHSLFPLDGEIAAAETHVSNMAEERSRKSLKKGLTVIDYLLREDFRVEYSPASELELMVGRARGKAIESAAAEKIPDRMWTRFFDKEIDDRLLGDDLTEIRNGVERLVPTLEEAGIDVTPGNADRTRDVLELAKDITGLVYLSVIDSLIYAGALVAEAEQLISDDDYLKKTVRRIKNEPSLRRARQRLEERIAAVLSREPGTITLPDAAGIPTARH